eukprot:PhM_4_TR14654/c0_g1_i1/m.90910
MSNETTVQLNNNFFHVVDVCTTVWSGEIFNKRNTASNSISITLKNVANSELIHSANVRFTAATNNTSANPLCAFYNFSEDRYSTSGCSSKRLSAASPIVSCECNHLTDFALIDYIELPPPTSSSPPVMTATPTMAPAVAAANSHSSGTMVIIVLCCVFGLLFVSFIVDQTCQYMMINRRKQRQQLVGNRRRSRKLCKLITANPWLSPFGFKASSRHTLP